MEIGKDSNRNRIKNRVSLDMAYSKTGEGGHLDKTVKGFLYLIDINDAAGLDQENQRNLETFKAIVGERAMKSVIFVTTKWAMPSEKSRRSQNRRLGEWTKEVNSRFQGARIVLLDGETSRYDDGDLADMSDYEAMTEKQKYSDNALKVIEKLVENEKVVPQIQEEVKDDNATMGSISVSKVAIGHLQEDTQKALRLGWTGEAFELMVTGKLFSEVKARDAKKVMAIRAAGRNAFNSVLGEILAQKWYDLGNVVLSLVELVSSQEQQQAVQKMFSAAAEDAPKFINCGVKLGAPFGRLGQIAGGVAGGLAQAPPFLVKMVKAWAFSA